MVTKHKKKKDKIKFETISSSVNDDVIDIPKKEPSEQIQSATLLMNDKFKRRKTILSNRQVAIITTIDVISQLYDIVWLQHWLDNFAEWRTSGDGGRGRSDITDIFKFASLHEQDKYKELIPLLRGNG